MPAGRRIRCSDTSKFLALPHATEGHEKLGTTGVGCACTGASRNEMEHWFARLFAVHAPCSKGPLFIAPSVKQCGEKTRTSPGSTRLCLGGAGLYS